jgi:phospholipid transport system substrate-binding protein
MITKLNLTVAAAAILALTATPVLASPDATAFVNNLGNQLETVAGQPSAVQRQPGFRRLFEGYFDISAMGRFVLGRYGRQMKPPEQQQFLCYFEDYVVINFSDKFWQFIAGSTIKVISTLPYNGETVVYSQINRGSDRPVRVDWHLVPVGNAYKVSDVVIDGLSMTFSGRSDLEGVVGRNNGQVSSILPVMRQQIASSLPDHCRVTPIEQTTNK